MLVRLALLFAVAYARPIGPIPPFLDLTRHGDGLIPFESPLYTPDAPNFSPIVDDFEPDPGFDGAFDASFPPNSPESSLFPAISLASTPSVSVSASASVSGPILPSASIPPRISPAASQTSLPATSPQSTPPPILVSASSTPAPSNRPTTPATPSLSTLATPAVPNSQSPKTEQTPTDTPATVTPTGGFENDKKRRVSDPPSTSPQISPPGTSPSTPLRTNNPRVTNESGAPVPALPSLGPDGLPTPSPLPPPTMSQRVTCFPASATVALLDGSVVRMSELSVGDFVHVGNGSFSRVHLFTHRVEEVREEFVRLKTESGAVLTVSEGHYVYVGTVLKPAREVSVGDYLPLGEGGFTKVENVETVFETGLYNPQTEAGDIVVDGIKASVYTEAVQPALAHAALLPFRVAFSVFGMTTQFADRGFPDSVPLFLRSLLSQR